MASLRGVEQGIDSRRPANLCHLAREIGKPDEIQPRFVSLSRPAGAEASSLLLLIPQQRQKVRAKISSGLPQRTIFLIDFRQPRRFDRCRWGAISAAARFLIRVVWRVAAAISRCDRKSG
jgi:hypothetical protein